jgi:calcium/calmodulin-dependent protein kinase I
MGFYSGKESLFFLKRLKEYDARKIFKQILEAIQYLHSNYVCHRDLKPSNTLCTVDCKNVNITDFNVSKFSDDYKAFDILEKHGKIEMWTYTGTVTFSAPEIKSGGQYK